MIELDKQSAPAVTLESFNYFFNKAINQFVNKQYNVGADTDQQRTDDLRVLKASAILQPYEKPATLNSKAKDLLGDNLDILGAANVSSIFGATYTFNLPADYLHLLNCICFFKVNKRINCPYNVGDIIEKGAIKINSDAWPLIVDNLYMKPSYKRPYYYIINLNSQTYNPTNPIDVPIKNGHVIDLGSSIQTVGTDVPTKEHIENEPNYIDPNKNELVPNRPIGPVSNESGDTAYTQYNRSIKIKIPGVEYASNDSTVVKTAGHRYGNASNVRLEIRYGKDSSVFQLIGIKIDYIKAPQFIRLTQEQLDLTEDISQTLEFPDYVCQEIVNELVKLILENTSDPRMQTQPAVSMSIAAPAQAQTPQTSKK